MSKMQTLCEKMETVTKNALILEGAAEFVKLNVDDGNAKGLCDILCILAQTAKAVAREMMDVEMLAIEIEGAM